MLLVLQLLQKGVRVVQLTPNETIYDSRSDTTAIILMLVELSRGHSESKVKSERLTASWDRRKQLARDGKLAITKRVPAWIEKRDGKLVAVPERVKVVKRIFALAIAGNGLSRIVRQLEKDGVKPWLNAECWRRSYLAKLVRRRLVLGEYQPEKDGKPDGPPIIGYYPQVIDPQTWQRAQDALTGRKGAGGRTGAKVTNIFQGLLWDARSSAKMYITWRDRGSEPRRRGADRVRVLRPSQALESYQGATAFPYAVFESAILGLLKEIDPADVTGSEPESDSARAAAELAALDTRAAALELELASGDVPALARSLRAIEARRAELLEEVAKARREPLVAVWTETASLLDVTDEPGRLRLRSLLRGAIEGVWLLLLGAGRRRLCVAQVRLRSGLCREVLIEYRSGSRTRPAEWSARSFAAGVPPFDLRTPEGVTNAETIVAAMDAD